MVGWYLSQVLLIGPQYPWNSFNPLGEKRTVKVCVSLRQENDGLIVLLQEGRMPRLWSVSEVLAEEGKCPVLSCLRRLRLSRRWCENETILLD